MPDVSSTPSPPSLPTVWFLTHDEHGGGRVFAPVAALRRWGWRVRLFHRTSPPPALTVAGGGMEDLFAPACRRFCATVRILPYEACGFASVRRLLDPLRAILRQGRKPVAPWERKDGWRFRLLHLPQGEMMLLARSEDSLFCGARNGILIYDEATDHLVLSNAPPTERIEGMVLHHALRRLRPDLRSETVADLCFGTRSDASGIIPLADGDHCGFDGDGSYAIGRSGHADLHLLPPEDRWKPPAPVVDALAQFWRYIPSHGPGERVLSHIAREGAMERPDLILVADLPLLPTGLALKERFGCPLLYDAHEWAAEEKRLWNADDPSYHDAMLQLEAALYPICDLRVTCGERLATAMGQATGTIFRTLYTCSGLVDAPPPPQPGAKARAHVRSEEWGIPEDSRVAVFVGNLTPERSLEDLMRATRHLGPGQILLVAGGGRHAETVRRILDEEGNPQRVRLLGPIPFDRVDHLLSYSDLGVIPFQPERSLRPDYLSMAMPAKFADYHRMTLPILVSGAMGECADIVRRAGIGRCWTGTGPDVIGPALAELLNDGDALTAMRAAYGAAPALFSFDRLRKNLAECLADLGLPTPTA